MSRNLAGLAVRAVSVSLSSSDQSGLVWSGANFLRDSTAGRVSHTAPAARGRQAVSNTLKTEHLPKRAGGEVAEPRGSARIGWEATEKVTQQEEGH